MPQNSESKGLILQQKKIGLLYIIFIVLAFLYIPADFVDIFKGTNDYFEGTTDENEKLFKYNMRIIDYFTKNDQDSVHSIKRFYLLVNQSSSDIIRQIEIYKQSLIQLSGGLNESGYIRRGKNYEIAKKILIRSNVVDTLKQLLSNHKDLLKTIAHKEMYPIMDSILYLDKFISSSGELKEFSEYYFDLVPVSASVAFLSKFQNDIRRIDNYVIESHFKSLISLNKKLGLGVVLKEPKQELIISKSVISKLGKEIIIAMEFTDDTSAYEYEEHDESTDDNILNMSLTSQNYSSLGLSDNKFTVQDYYEESIDGQKNKDIKPILEMGQLPVLYIGINNLIKISDIKFKGEKIRAEISSGTIIRKDSNFYIRVSKPGFSQINVYGIEGNRKMLISNQKFIVKELPEPKAFIYNRHSGDISSKMFKLQKKINIRNDILKNINYRLIGYNIKRINNFITETSYNNGSYFNASSRQLIDKASNSDVYIFENIKVESIDGKEMILSPVTVTIL